MVLRGFVSNNKEAAVAAACSVVGVDVSVWEAGLEDLFGRVAGCFPSDQPRVQARAYVAGLLSRTERKNSWTLAEFNGDSGPQKMKRLLNEYVWNADAVRDVVAEYVVENLAEPDGVLVVDETGFLKKGDRSAGVQRQYSGTAGRVENCQLGVFAAYVSGKGRAFVDRELYVPASWTDDRPRCAAAGVPRRVGFATKPLLALDMIRRFRLTCRTLRWVAGDEAYGGDPELRDWLEEHQIGFVLGIRRDLEVTTAVGRRRVDTLAGLVPAGAWETYAAADGSKGPRLYDWALIDTTDRAGFENRAHQVLVRRGRDQKRELAFFLTHSPTPVPLATLVTVAGRRWGIEECFQSAKNEVGLDHYQVRLYHAWYRHITLAMLAHAWLAITAAKSRTDSSAGTPTTVAVGYQRLSKSLPIADQPPPDRNTMIPFTLNEIRHLVALTREEKLPGALVAWWSSWRRRHQATARHYHFQRRIHAAQPPAAPA
jgi:SRSO17 transposase